MNESIFIVEDEIIVAMGIKRTLTSIGYNVAGMAPSGEEALRKISVLKPDLIMMDIQLKGKLDGIETAGEIRTKYNIPVIFLTAYADSKTLKRAKESMPFGYLVKPFQVREMKIAIDFALVRARMERRLRESESRFRGLAESIGDGVIIMENERIVFANDKACQLLGKSRKELMNFSNSETRDDGEDTMDLEFMFEDTSDLVITAVGLGTWIADSRGNRRCIQRRTAYYRRGKSIPYRYIILSDITDKVSRNGSNAATTTPGIRDLKKNDVKGNISIPEKINIQTRETTKSDNERHKPDRMQSLEDILNYLDNFQNYNGIIRQRDHAVIKQIMNIKKQAILIPFIMAGESEFSEWLNKQAEYHSQIVSESLKKRFHGDCPPRFLPLSDDLIPPVYAVGFDNHKGMKENIRLIKSVIPASIVVVGSVQKKVSVVEIAGIFHVLESITDKPVYVMLSERYRYAFISPNQWRQISESIDGLSQIDWLSCFISKQLPDFITRMLSDISSIS